MALVISDRVKETTTTSGTGTYTLGGAVTGFETFTANLSDGDTTYYACTDNTDFEVGLGTFTASGTTLARTTILASSNSGSAVDWGAGTRTVFCTLPAAKTVFLDGSNVANISNLKLASGATVTAILDEDGLSSDSATSLATQQSIKAYVDAQVTAQDLDFQGDTGGALSIDLDSETLDIAGGTGIDTSGSSNTLTVAIDSTVATLSGTQTLTNKSIDASQLTGTVANARLDAQLQDVAGLAVTDGNFIVGDGANFVAESGATARTSLGLGSIATLNTVTLTTNTTGDYVATITAGEGITGAASGEGSTPTLAVDLNELTTSTADADGDFFAVVDSVGAQKKLTKGNIAISGFNNDSGFIDGSSLNADNLSSGTVPTARVSGSYTGITAVGTLTSLTTSGNVTSDHVLPNTSDTYDLGATDNVWRNVYTGDLHLSNEAKEEGNAVDGTKGNWTI